MHLWFDIGSKSFEKKCKTESPANVLKIKLSYISQCQTTVQLLQICRLKRQLLTVSTTSLPTSLHAPRACYCSWFPAVEVSNLILSIPYVTHKQQNYHGAPMQKSNLFGTYVALIGARIPPNTIRSNSTALRKFTLFYFEKKTLLNPDVFAALTDNEAPEWEPSSTEDQCIGLIYLHVLRCEDAVPFPKFVNLWTE